ncbi:MAG: hypothetical protein V1492_00615 [Candidatus Micrarchaeota archaeon]
MKAQATLELLMFFLVAMATVALITQPLLQAYAKTSEKSAAARELALVEDDILANEIQCNSRGAAPAAVLPQSTVKRRTENWRVLISRNSTEFWFPGIFKGCKVDYETKFA